MSEADETDEGTESDLDPLAGNFDIEDYSDDQWRDR
jgi:hypothetical protein